MKSLVRLWQVLPALLLVGSLRGQPLSTKNVFTRQDSLRGSLNEERTGWDVLYYDLSITPDYSEKSISGTVEIQFKVTRSFALMQIDLQEPLNIARVEFNQAALPFTREGNAYHIRFPRTLEQGREESLRIHYSGQPRVAVNPPWDGGWIFTTDQKGRPWMSVACQGLGASAWYPCKDHQSDEPDRGARLHITVADTLVAVANGRLQSKVVPEPGLATYTWSVVNPINNYNIIPYIGKYVSWKEPFAGEKGTLDCTFWVLDYELPRAREQFTQVPRMLRHFEYWFGPYPFYEDGYQLVQSPHLGMEHQSAVAYGNGFQNGYRGRDLSGSGWGKKWDFIIVHESGHEWFANNVTTADIADMWIHEGFTNYSETLFTTSEFGIEAGNDYVIGTRRLIRNDQPIIGPYGVNREGSGDMYYKGGNLLHMIRKIVQDDNRFRSLLRGINSTWHHRITTSAEVEKYISAFSGVDCSKIFDQYLRTTQIPELEYRVEQDTLFTRWRNCVPGFTMPVRIWVDQQPLWVHPTESWGTSITGNPIREVVIDRNFYITQKKS